MTDPQQIVKGKKRLALLVRDRTDVTLDELLIWYQDPDDLADIATFTREQVERSIGFYIQERSALDSNILEQAPKLTFELILWKRTHCVVSMHNRA